MWPKRIDLANRLIKAAVHVSVTSQDILGAVMVKELSPWSLLWADTPSPDPGHPKQEELVTDQQHPLALGKNEKKKLQLFFGGKQPKWLFLNNTLKN